MARSDAALELLLELAGLAMGKAVNTSASLLLSCLSCLSCLSLSSCRQI